MFLGDDDSGFVGFCGGVGFVGDCGCEVVVVILKLKIVVARGDSDDERGGAMVD